MVKNMELSRKTNAFPTGGAPTSFDGCVDTKLRTKKEVEGKE